MQIFLKGLVFKDVFFPLSSREQSELEKFKKKFYKDLKLINTYLIGFYRKPLWGFFFVFAAVAYLDSADLCCVVSAGFSAPGSETWGTPALLVSHDLPPAEKKINDQSSSVQKQSAFK